MQIATSGMSWNLHIYVVVVSLAKRNQTKRCNCIDPLEHMLSSTVGSNFCPAPDVKKKQLFFCCCVFVKRVFPLLSSLCL